MGFLKQLSVPKHQQKPVSERQGPVLVSFVPTLGRSDSKGSCSDPHRGEPQLSTSEWVETGCFPSSSPRALLAGQQITLSQESSKASLGPVRYLGS